jgi:DNA-binding MarR family transcriptional regulator
MEFINSVARLNRLNLDLMDEALDQIEVKGLTAHQALIILNIGDERIPASSITDRGYYLGSNVSYNLRKLVDLGYLDQKTSEHDRRVFLIQVTDEGRKLSGELKMALCSRLAARQEIQKASKLVDESASALRSLELEGVSYAHPSE